MAALPHFQNVSMKVISALQMQDIEMEEWQRLPKLGRSIGGSGRTMSSMWEWTLTCRKTQQTTQKNAGCSPDLQHKSELADMAEDAKLQLHQYLQRSQSLDRRSSWAHE